MTYCESVSTVATSTVCILAAKSLVSIAHDSLQLINHMRSVLRMCGVSHDAYNIPTGTSALVVLQVAVAYRMDKMA